VGQFAQTRFGLGRPRAVEAKRPYGLAIDRADVERVGVVRDAENPIDIPLLIHHSHRAKRQE
jgi:hypothetical protein